MKSEDRWSLAEWLEYVEDKYGIVIDESPEVQGQYQCIMDKIGCIRNTLEKGGASAEIIEAVDELDDELVDLLTKVIDSLAHEAVGDLYIAFHTGMLFGKMLAEKEACRSKQDDKQRNER